MALRTKELANIMTIPHTQEHTSHHTTFSASIVLCRHCAQPLTSERTDGTSPGCGETEHYAPDGGTWCPGDGAQFASCAEWLAAVREHGYDGRPCQYHNVLSANEIAFVSDLLVELSRTILKLAA